VNKCACVRHGRKTHRLWSATAHAEEEKGTHAPQNIRCEWRDWFLVALRKNGKTAKKKEKKKSACHACACLLTTLHSPVFVSGTQAGAYSPTSQVGMVHCAQKWHCQEINLINHQRKKVKETQSAKATTLEMLQIDVASPGREHTDGSTSFLVGGKGFNRRTVGVRF
jgi:hypothetical protein